MLELDGVGQVVRVRYGVEWSGQTTQANPASHANRPTAPGAATYPTRGEEQEFSWDALGNRRWMVVQGGGQNGEPLTSFTLRNGLEGLNRYRVVTLDAPGASAELALAHDRWGRVTRDQGRLFDWDPEGRLRSVRLAADGTLVAGYVYDALGRRVSRTVYAADGLAVDHVLRCVWDGDRVIEGMGQVVFFSAGR